MEFATDSSVNRKLQKVSVIVTALFVMLFLFSVITSYVVHEIVDDFDTTDKMNLARSYAIDIRRQALNDQESLENGAFFIDPHGITNESNVASFNRSNFNAVGICKLDSTCEIMTSRDKTFFVPFAEIDEALIEVVTQAWMGRNTTSGLFESKFTGDRVISFATPVYDNSGKICSVYFAQRVAATLSLLLSEHFGRQLYRGSVFLVDSNGNILATAGNVAIKRFGDTIYSAEDFSYDFNQRMQEAIRHQQSESLSVSIYNKDYTLYMVPVGFNDWYILSLSAESVKDIPIYNSIMMLIYLILFAVLVVVCAGVVFLFIIKKSFQAQLRMANYDSLTNASTYNKFRYTVQRQLELNQEFSVIATNIRDFRYISEMFGDKLGDHLLEAVVRLSARFSAISLVCRTDADQFYFIINLHDEERIRGVMLQLSTMISNAGLRFNCTYPILVYSGVAMSTPGDNPSRLVQKAQFAHGFANKPFTHYVQFYNENMHRKYSELKTIESDMRSSLENGEFKMYLQPKVDIRTGKVCAAEALVRWIKDGKLMMPNDFVPVFTKNGFCVELDLYMFQQACNQIKAWTTAGYDPIPISVNQSKMLFFSTGYVDNLRRMLTTQGVDPRYLVVEILESIAARNVDELNSHIEKIHELGIKVSLDDFGSAYSSLNLFTSLDVDEVKFDNHFLLEKDQAKKEKNKLILGLLIPAFKKFDKVSVAEGVETAEDLAFLKEIGCDVAQGYYYSKPIPVDEFETRFMADRKVGGDAQG
ncbi:MAG: EAL domain-containing protein [Succinivibrionaceae bacterium]|nr:EAL domain-containing protein [Succinivibrionaceae bacterium]